MATMTKRALTQCLVLLLMLIVFAAPVAAVDLKIDLDKTYKFDHANLSTMLTVDLGDPSVSNVEFLTTQGDNSDVQVIYQPTINHIRRTFINTTGTFKGNTLTVVGDTDSTVCYNCHRPEYRIYTRYTVPTFKVTVPGGEGNPVILKYNDSWETGDTSSIESIVHATDKRWLFKVDGILFQDSDGYFGSNFTTYNESDIPFTLSQNMVGLNPFSATSTRSKNVALTASRQVQTGKYFAGALVHNESNATTTIYALAPVVALQEKTPIVWNDLSGTYTTSPLMLTYTKGSNGNATLSFGGSNHAAPTMIGYVIINSSSGYEMNVTVDTEILAENANTRWSTLAADAPIVQLLYKSVTKDIGSGYTYNITADGKQTPPSANTYSNIAITEGYGISGNASGTSITVPGSSLGSLNDGLYYVYLLGTNDDKNIVAMDQGMVKIQSPVVVNPPTIASITPANAYKNSTINFTLTGTNFPTTFGVEGINVTLQKVHQTTMPATVMSVSKTTITGYITIQPFAEVNNAVNKTLYDVVLTTPDFGQTIKSGAFTVKPNVQPAVTAISPTKANRNSTVNFTITGTNFQTGYLKTSVNMSNNRTATPFDDIPPTYQNRNNITLISVTETRIDGYMDLAWDAPLGGWNVTVITEDGGESAVKAKLITIQDLPKPTISSLSPTSGWYPNTTVSWVIKGANFKEGQTTVVVSNMTAVGLDFWPDPVVVNVSATQMDGTIEIPANATLNNRYNISVRTIDSGDQADKATAFTVAKLAKPSIGSLSPNAVGKNTTVNFTLTGMNFQTGDFKTNVRLYENVTDTEMDVYIISLTPTKILGSVVVDEYEQSGKYILEVNTTDGGVATKLDAFTVGYTGIPTITTVSPQTGYRNDTVQFTIKGTNFQPGKTTVLIRNQTDGTTLAATDLSSVTTTQIIGNITIPAVAPTGFYRYDVITTDGGSVSKVNALKVMAVSAPKIGAITPTSGAKNSTVAFTLTGSNFQLDDKTTVTVVDDATGTELTTNIYSVTSGKIIGALTIAGNAPASKYRLEVKTTDGGTVNKFDAFTVIASPTPTITSISPNFGYQNQTTSFVLKGKDFIDGGTTVRIRTFAQTVTADLSSTNSTTIVGTFTIPADAPKGAYRLDVITVGGGFSSKTGGFTVKDNLKPAITSVNPNNGYRNTTVAFTIKGTNFLPDATTIRFVNQSTLAKGPAAANEANFTTTIFSATSTEIIGSTVIDLGAPVGLWTINVTTPDGGEVAKTGAFTVKKLGSPTITTVAPTAGAASSDVSFTITGKDFLPNKGTNVTFIRTSDGAKVYANVNSISSTNLNGIATMPALAGATDTWDVLVITLDGGKTTKTKVLTTS